MPEDCIVHLNLALGVEGVPRVDYERNCLLERREEEYDAMRSREHETFATTGSKISYRVDALAMFWLAAN